MSFPVKIFKNLQGASWEGVDNGSAAAQARVCLCVGLFVWFLEQHCRHRAGFVNTPGSGRGPKGECVYRISSLSLFLSLFARFAGSYSLAAVNCSSFFARMRANDPTGKFQ